MLKKIVIWFVIPLLLIQFIKIDITKSKQIDASLEIKTSKEVMSILNKSCYDCHSYNTKIPWYGDIAPFSWEVRGHVKDARNWLNFQEWENYDESKKQKIFKGINRTVGKSMPIPMYLSFHEEAKMTKDEEIIIKKWAEKNTKVDSY